jgi:hypothetical protein
METHGFDVILASGLLKPIPIPITSPAVMFKNSFSEDFLIQISEGFGRVIRSDTSPSPLPDQYDRTFLLDTHDCDDPERESLLTIWHYFHDRVGCLFAAPVISLSLQFGIVDKSIYVLDGSVHFGPNPLLTDLFNRHEDGPRRFTDFLLCEMLACQSSSPGVCFSHFSTCQRGRYCCDLLRIVHYRASDLFPYVNTFRLYEAIKSRFRSFDFHDYRVPVCVSCVSFYTIVERHEKSDKIRMNKPKKVRPVFYDSFFHSEQDCKGKMFPLFPNDVGDDPYSYGINIRKHPYGEPPIPARAVAPPPRSHWTRSSLGHGPSLPTPSPRRFNPVVLWEPLEDPNLPPPQPSYSERRVPIVYGQQPFSLSFITGKPPKRPWLK